MGHSDGPLLQHKPGIPDSLGNGLAPFCVHAANLLPNLLHQHLESHPAQRMQKERPMARPEAQPTDTQTPLSRGRQGVRELGPSDTSDSGSDMAGIGDDAITDADSDAAGTGEGLDATGQAVEGGRDISPDSIITEKELFGPIDEPEA